MVNYSTINQLEQYVPFCSQHNEYVSNRSLGVIGGHIFRGETDKITAKTEMPPEEAEYMRSVELAGIGQRVWTNIRLRLKKFGTILPSYHRLVESTKPLKYPIQPFFGGWRANLKDIVKVQMQFILSSVIQILPPFTQYEFYECDCIF